MSLFPINSGPGAQTIRRATPRRIFEGNSGFATLPGGVYVNGTKSRDSGNTSNIDVLRCGLPMGIITATGLYAPSIIGAITEAVSSGGTSVTVSAAQATELVRRVGSTGTIRFVGPPSAAGTVATFTETYSAVNTTTGVITCSSLNADLIAGSFVCDNDGSYLPLSFIPDGFGLKVTDQDGNSISSVQWSNPPISGTLLAENLIHWPSDTSLQAWMIASLNGAAGGQFVFPDYRYRV